MIDDRKAVRSSGLVYRAATSALGVYVSYVAHGLRHPELMRACEGPDERRALPGDDVVPEPHWSKTFTIEIDTTPARVWPWLVQMGYGRAGYYTWYRYDNGGVASADTIVPDLQELAVGDVIPDGPLAHEGFGVWRVLELAPDRSLVLVSRRQPFTGREISAADTSNEMFIDCSWVFVLEPLEGGRTKLLVRVRARFERVRRASLVARLVQLVFGVGDNVMERTLLEGIKRRAERAAARPRD